MSGGGGEGENVSQRQWYKLPDVYRWATVFWGDSLYNLIVTMAEKYRHIGESLG